MHQKVISRSQVRIPITGFVDYVGDGVLGTGLIQDFSVDGWHITTIEPRPIHVGMSLVLHVMLTHRPTAIRVEVATVQWVSGREFGVQVVRMNSNGEVSTGVTMSDKPLSESRAHPRPRSSRQPEEHVQKQDGKAALSKIQSQGGVGDDPK